MSDELDPPEGPEVRRHRGIVMQKQAELELANADLTAARKAEYVPVSKSQLFSIASTLGKAFRVLSPVDYENGWFEYRSRVEPTTHGQTVTIGGYLDNDRFRSAGVFIQRMVWEEFLHKSAS